MGTGQGGGESRPPINDSWKQQPTIGRCALCPDYVFEGTAEEVTAAGDKHRLKKHPELTKRQRAGTKSSIMKWRQTLSDEETEEIQASRTKRMFLIGISEEE